jgi:SAM-dependent methyltransferase
MLCALRGQGFEALGVEMSWGNAAFCRAKGLSVVVAAVPSLPFANATFDAVFALHVVEHFPEPIAFVEELARVVQPGGAIVLSTEDAWCAQYAWDRLRARLSGRLPPFRTSNDHTFVFLAKHLEILLKGAGCDVIETRAYHAVAPESLHWKLYKGTFRLVDRVLGHGDYLLTVGRRKPLSRRGNRPQPSLE